MKRSNFIVSESKPYDPNVREYFAPEMIISEPFAEFIFPITETAKQRLSKLGETAERIVTTMAELDLDNTVEKVFLRASSVQVHRASPNVSWFQLETTILTDAFEQIHGVEQVEYDYATTMLPELVTAGSR